MSKIIRTPEELDRALSPDPTAIDIAFDPTQQRMRGVATHGHTPFDVPYISQISDQLWQGGCRNGLILPAEIDFVVSLYPWEKYTLHDGASRLEVRMYDSEDQAMDQVDDIARTVIEQLDHGNTVLVHCQAGLNRSSLVAARVLMIDGGWTAEEAIFELREKRSPACLCNRAFEQWLLSHDGAAA